MKKIKRIIVEGPDQQGKTTVCSMLSDHFGWDIVHFGPPDEKFDFFDDYILDEHTISDRNFLSEICYSKAKGKKHRVEDVDKLQQKMEGTIVIYVDRLNEFIFEKRNEMYTKEFIDRVREIYRIEIYKLNLPLTVFIPGQSSYESLILNLSKWM